MVKAVIQVYGEIGWNVNIMDIQHQFNSVENADSIELRIFSPGGDCMMGWAIYDYLKGLNLPIDTYNDGYCASMATVLFLLGKNRYSTEHSSNLIHLPWTIGEGNSLDFQDAVEELQKEENRILQVYTSVTGQSEEKLRAIMVASKELDAQEFLELGFATEILKNEVDSNMKSLCAKKFAVAAQKNIQDQLTKKELKEIKNQNMNILAKINALFNSITGIKNLSVDTDQGTLYSESDIVKGAKVFTDEEMTVPAPNGNYSCSDGSEKYTVSDGEVIEVEDMEGPDEDATEDKKSDDPEDKKAKKDDDPEDKKAKKDPETQNEDEEMKKALTQVVLTMKALSQELTALKQELADTKASVQSNFKPVSGSRSSRIAGAAAEPEKYAAFTPKGDVAKGLLNR